MQPLTVSEQAVRMESGEDPDAKSSLTRTSRPERVLRFVESGRWHTVCRLLEYPQRQHSSKICSFLFWGIEGVT